MPRWTPPWDSIPWYITAFQSSPVRIWGRQESQNNARDRQVVTHHANLTEYRIKLLYRVKGYEHRLIEGLSLCSLGDRGYTDQSFPLIKMTDNNRSFSRKSLIYSKTVKCQGLTWNTVRMAAGKVSKFVVGVSSSKLNLKQHHEQHHYKEWKN